MAIRCSSSNGGFVVDSAKGAIARAIFSESWFDKLISEDMLVNVVNKWPDAGGF
jgi:hypothetical protein